MGVQVELLENKTYFRPEFRNVRLGICYIVSVHNKRALVNRLKPVDCPYQG